MHLFWRWSRATQRVEQIIVLTDEGENTAPYFTEAYQRYADALGVRPDVVLVKVGDAVGIPSGICVAYTSLSRV